MFCEDAAVLETDRQDAVTVDATDYVNVAARARELGCRPPVGIALLPGNFATAAGAAELRYHEAAPEVRSAWRSIGLIDAGPNLMLERALAHGPAATGMDVPLVAYFGRELCSGPTRLVTYALGAVASVLSAYRGHAGASPIRFDAVVERPGRGSYACIQYRGDACELVELAGAVREILTGNPMVGIDDDVSV
jgi:hypothetical protein